ncbi:MAG: hypothetical protein UW41_C0004G0020 [Candidatus Collierbacteria bacterium GW2011_GWC2_44_18]|uniref:Uncharacterized protein n=1 Tax=Candidatus Collierbacteria bacterium GW2011_GWC2_44_18 TaxID=1618392 RepID=A0A0G1KNT6_9BACT|nr:MAG: hypothetical protein UW41_C0004G0020 [Candidatus Collierbacteria bacterium GW2011_GWC2_44_18]
MSKLDRGNHSGFNNGIVVIASFVLKPWRSIPLLDCRATLAMTNWWQLVNGYSREVFICLGIR